MREAKMRYQTIQEFNSNTALTPIKDLSCNPKLLVPSPILLLMLAACGGGGGGGGSPRPAVTAPTSLDPDLLSGLQSTTTDENNADFSHELLPTAELAELEGEVTLSLAASGEGNDNEFFVIDSNGNLILSDEADASVVFDHETTPTRTVSVTATATDDPSENLTRDVVISINDIADEAPVFTTPSNYSVRENSPSPIVRIIAKPDIDGTPITYTIEENAVFEIDSDSGILSLKQNVTLVPEIHTVRVTATDDSNTALTASQDITIIVTGTPSSVNEAPTALSLSHDNLSINEGTTTARMLATITITDADGGNNVVEVSDNTLFEIRNENELWLRAGVNLDYETVADRINEVTVSIQGHSGVSDVFTLNVDDVDENVVDQAPTALSLSANNLSINEGTTTARELATITITDADGGNNEVEVSNTTLFEIRNGNELWLKAGVNLDYETVADRSNQVTVSIQDHSGVSDVFTLNVDDVDDVAPTALSLSHDNLSINEGTTTARELATITITDADGGIIYHGDQ